MIIAIAGLLLGGLVGGALGHSFDTALSGAFFGLIAGLVINRRRKRPAAAVATAGAFLPVMVADGRIDTLERRLARVEAALAKAGLAVPEPAAAIAAAARVTLPIEPEASPSAPAAERDEIAAAPVPVAVPEMARAADGTIAATARIESAPPNAPAYLAPAPAAPNPVWAWITGGNTLARVGIIVLFIGVGFLLKYAAEHVTVPIELRIAGVALGGIALLVLGWTLRTRRTAYAMILQGGGVGVLYLTVFAALKLYALVPAPAAFALLVAIAALSSVLAVRQDSIALAAVGVIGGFLAPILTSSDSGNHVLLFSYYALLNAGIFGIAWFKAWRLLNLLGFLCTFVIGTAWGVTRYRPEHFATTEPFLILFFLFYVGIAVLYALRRSVELRHYVDGTIVFGTPLFAAGLQHALVRQYEFGMAISAVAASALYLVLARILWTRRRDDLRLIVESFLALGVVFATLAVPLAFDARWTSATWALEGAAIVWIGVRQQRIAARVFGLLLQLAAGVAFGLGWTVWVGHAAAHPLPILNSEFIGAALIALAGLVSAFVYQRSAVELTSVERQLTPVVFGWGALWWLVAGGRQIDRWVQQERRLAVLVAFLAGTALAFAFAARRLSWPLARIPALLLLPALVAIAIAGAFHGVMGGEAWHLFGHGGWLAWPIAVVAVVVLLRGFERNLAYDRDSWVLRISHAGLLWLLAVVAAQEIAWVVDRFVGANGVWRDTVWGVVPAVALALVCSLAVRTEWPVGVHRRAYLVAGAGPLVGWMLLWSFFIGILSDGDPAPLPFVPIVNPVDLALGLVVATMLEWMRELRREGLDLDTKVPREVRIGVPAALVFLWLNALVLRTLHHWFGVDWSLPAMWASTLVQAVVSILWAVIALGAMVVANRRGARVGWIAGAVLLAVVVAKLFIVDLSRIGGIERIVSFIGVGLLLLLIGYLAPVPARRKEEA